MRAVGIRELKNKLSAYLRLSKAGFGCAEWPQCYGQNVRQAPTGQASQSGPLLIAPADPAATTAARLTHRVVAVTALLLVLAMLMICFGTRPSLRAEGAMALALLVLALLLAVLGRWSSGVRVPAVTIGNLLGGFAMLALCARLTRSGRPRPGTGLRGWLMLALVLAVLQVMLGGLVSASYSGLSCDGLINCFKTASPLHWEALSPWREPGVGASVPVQASGALVQLLHRGLAVILVVVLLRLVVGLSRTRRWAALSLAVLVLAQVAAGMTMMQSTAPLAGALLHNLLAAGLVATLVLLL